MMLSFYDEDGSHFLVPKNLVILDCPSHWISNPGDILSLSYDTSGFSFIFRAKVIKGKCLELNYKEIGLTLENMKQFTYVDISRFDKLKAFI